MQVSCQPWSPAAYVTAAASTPRSIFASAVHVNTHLQFTDLYVTEPFNKRDGFRQKYEKTFIYRNDMHVESKSDED